MQGLFSAISYRWGKNCDNSCRFGTKVAVFRTYASVWGIKCRFRDDFFVRAIFGNFFNILRQIFQILTVKLGCPTDQPIGRNHVPPVRQ